ncbi:MAG: TetR/AcrR family transcriptional regulator [Rhodoferax sp.]|nr:TetR/AcrR family transcriptional regulator [Rhodoferax sp.]
MLSNKTPPTIERSLDITVADSAMNSAPSDESAVFKGIPSRRRKATGLRHDDKCTAILRTAAQLFAANGYEATSLDMIADQLGMHKATLYHYVDNKESILYQCLVKSFGDLDNVMKSMEDRSIPVLQRLRIFVHSLALAQNNDFGRCLVLVGSRPLDMMPGGEIRQFRRRLDVTVRALITEGIADGSIKPCHPGLFSALLFGALNWVPRWYSETGKLDLSEVVDTFMNMLTQGIATPQR